MSIADIEIPRLKKVTLAVPYIYPLKNMHFEDGHTWPFKRVASISTKLIHNTIEAAHCMQMLMGSNEARSVLQIPVREQCLHRVQMNVKPDNTTYSYCRIYISGGADNGSALILETFNIVTVGAWSAVDFQFNPQHFTSVDINVHLYKTGGAGTSIYADALDISRLEDFE